MPAVARIGDTTMGDCLAGHPKYPKPGVGGIIMAGSGSTFADGIPVARIGDSVLCLCGFGHTSAIVSGSGVSFADGIPVARIGDSVSGPYVATIVSGSGSTFSA